MYLGDITPKRRKTMTDEINENESEESERTWTEEIEIAGGQLVDRVKELLEEGSVRRLIIRRPNNEILMEIPLTAGVAVGGVFTFFAPLLAALGALAALIADLKVEIVRVEDGDETADSAASDEE
jgi:vacuolar-type H+-ATPase subunit I/STV1